MRFKQLLEDMSSRHITHVEELMFNQDVNQPVEYIDWLISHMKDPDKSDLVVSEKIDGAPAVIFGIDPDNGKFFVSTKGIFNKTPKINYTLADIKKNHEGGVVKKLEACLTYLPEIVESGIYGGDLLFTEDLKLQNIDGVEYQTCKPNTITYAFDKGLDKKLGIVIHTKYDGSVLNLDAKYDFDLDLLESKNVLWFSNRLHQKFDIPKVSLKLDQTNFDDKIPQYINKMIREDQYISTDDSYISGLETFLGTKVDRKEIKELFDFMIKVNEIKLGILKQVKFDPCKAFIKVDNKWIPTIGEGLVVYDKQHDIISKIINRMIFSRFNFNLEKDWD